MNKLILIFALLFSCNYCFAENLKDDLPESVINKKNKINTHTEYNYESIEKIPLQIKIMEEIKSENDVYEGQIIKFKIAKDIIHNNKVIFKRGDLVSTKISLIISSGMNGIPASIIFKDFSINNIPSNNFTESYEIFGQDRSLLVFPLKWALTILPPTGSFTNFIKGGHAKIKPKKTYTIFYYPNWT